MESHPYRAARLLLLASLVGCSRDPEPPPLDPAVERAQDLAGAGDSGALLCGVVQRWPGTPEGQQALALASASRQKALAALPEVVQTRGTKAEVARLVEGMLTATPQDPCQNFVTVHLTREISSDPVLLETPTGSTMIGAELIRFSRDWADMQNLAEGLAEGLREATSRWVTVSASLDPPPEPRYPSLHVRFLFQPAGQVVTERGARFPALEIVTIGEVRAAGATAATTFDLGATRLPATFDVTALPSPSGAGTPSGHDVLVEEVRLLWNAFAGTLTHRLGLVAPDPAWAPFAGEWELVGSPTGDGCGGQIVLGARHLRMDGVAQSVFADVVDRTYAARLDGGVLDAQGRFVTDGACTGTTIAERWQLRQTPEGTLAGTLESTWQLPPDCASQCTVRFEVTARRAAN